MKTLRWSDCDHVSRHDAKSAYADAMMGSAGKSPIGFEIGCSVTQEAHG